MLCAGAKPACVREDPVRELLDGRLAPRRPRHRPTLQEGLADRARLLVLALQLELARFMRPFLLGRRPHGRCRCRLARLEPEKAEQRMRDVRFDDGESRDGARHRDVERVHVELVQFERLVVLVSGAAILEVVTFYVGDRYAFADLAVGAALARNDVEEDDVRILEALGFVHAKQKRCSEALAGGRLVLLAQDDHGMLHRGAAGGIERPHRRFARVDQCHVAFQLAGAFDEEGAVAIDRAEACLLDLQKPIRELGDAARVAVVGVQDVQRLARKLLAGQTLPEHRLDCRPREEVRVDDLVGIAAQQELAGGLQA